MKKKLLTALVTGFFMFGMVGMARASATSIIDFGSPVSNSISIRNTTYLEDGYQIATSNTPQYISSRIYSVVNTGFNSFLAQYPSWMGGTGESYFDLNAIDGSSYSLLNFDAIGAESTSNLTVYPDHYLTVVGTKTDGSQISSEYYFGAYDWNGFDTLTLSSEWTDLTSVRFWNRRSDGYILYDNITLESQPVPVPATVFLLSTALAGLAGIRIRR